MASKKTSGIVCAIRGGIESKVTVTQAITLAQETGLPLHFLCVVNHDLLPAASGDGADVFSKQMHQMGRSVLEAAKAWAGTQGIRSQGIVRHGNVADEVTGVCRDIGADYLVLGRPRAQERENVFTSELFAQFIEKAGR